MRIFLRMMVMMVGLMATTPVAWALETVVQSEVGAGSAVAGSIGAVNARADALQGNVSAVNAVVNQQAQEIKSLKDQVVQLSSVVEQWKQIASNSQMQVQSIVGCQQSGKLWNGGGCVDAAASGGSHVVNVRTASAENVWRWPNATASCAGNEVVVGGGGNCHSYSVGDMRMPVSQPNGNGWYVSCDTAQFQSAGVTVYALCLVK